MNIDHDGLPNSRYSVITAQIGLSTVSETVSENTERVVKNSGGLEQIVLDSQRENPYSPRI
jgi:hypothetical protein